MALKNSSEMQKLISHQNDIKKLLNEVIIIILIYYNIIICDIIFMNE